MDEQQFWDIVDTSRIEADGRLDEQVETLHAQLSALGAEQVAAFDAMLTAANHALYTWDLWGAADLVLGAVADDTFTDVRSWVIAQGSRMYHRVADGADALADTDSDLTEDEVLEARTWADVADAVHTGQTGYSLGDALADRALRELPDEQPLGTQLSDEAADLAVHFPRLAARYR